MKAAVSGILTGVVKSVCAGGSPMGEEASATSAACRGSRGGWESRCTEVRFPGGADVAQAAKINNKASHAGYFNLVMGKFWRVIRLHTNGRVERFPGNTCQVEYAVFYQ